MFKFGKNPPRSLQSFGVSGLLGSQAEVFYESLFGTLHLGRVSDLLSSRLKESGTDELRLRALLLFGIFHGNRNTPTVGNNDITPLAVECGIDDEKIGIGIAFSLSAEDESSIQSLVDRVKAGQPSSSFDQTVMDLFRHSDRLIVRFQRANKRCELVALLATEGMAKEELSAEKKDFYFVEIPDQAEETPKPESYTELGDLDYPNLLKDGVRTKEQKEEVDKSFKISGTTEKIDDGVMKVKGGSTLDDGSMTVKTLGSERSSSMEKQLALYEERIKELNRKLQAFEDEKKKYRVGGGSSFGSPGNAGEEGEAGVGETLDYTSNSKKSKGSQLKTGSGPESDQAVSEPKERKNIEIDVTEDAEPNAGGAGLLGKMWPFKKKETTEAEPEYLPDVPTFEAAEAAVMSEEEKRAAALKVSPETVDSSKPVKPKEKEGEAPDPTVLGNELVAQISSGEITKTLSSLFKKNQEMLEQEKPKITSEFLDKLLNKLTREKIRIQRKFHDLIIQMKEREAFHKSRESSLNDEIAKRDETIKTKTTALNSANEQIATLNMNLERTKTSTKGSVSEQQFKSKLTHVNKMLEAAKSETAQAKKKVEELSYSLNQQRQMSKSQRHEEFAALKMKFDKTVSQMDEFKKVNRELNERITELEKVKAGPGNNKIIDDMKRQSEAAHQQLLVKKQEVDEYASRVKQLEAEIERLKAAAIVAPQPPPATGSDSAPASPPAASKSGTSSGEGQPPPSQAA